MYQSMLVRLNRSALATFSAIFALALAGGGLLIAPSMALAAATVTPASDGTDISIDTTSAPLGTGVYTELSGPTINEGAAGDISVGTHTITLPVGWEFNTGSTVTVYKTGGSSLMPVSQAAILTANTLTFTITQASTNPGSLAFILNNMQVRPTGTVSGTTGNMTYSGDGIEGVTGSTNFGTLSTVAGTVTKLAFTTQPSATTVYGSTLSQQPVVKTQDQFGNDSSSGASGKTATLSLAPDTGNLVGGTASLDISSGTASFSGLTVDMVGTKQLTAMATDLASANSSTFEITQKELTVSGLSATSRPYDGTTSAEVTGTPSPVGIVEGDDVSLAGTANGPFDDANVGSRTVIISGLSLSGADSTNYTLTQPTLDSSITAKSITVTPNSGQAKIYGEVDPTTFTYTNTALIGEDSITGVLGRNSGEDVGEFSYTLNTLSAGSNYSLILGGSEMFSITKRDLTVTATGVDKEYDRTTNATVNLSSDKISGDDVTLAYTTALFVTKSAENGKTINVGGISIGGAKAGNYDLQNTEAVATANITKKALTATLNLNNKTYDGDTSAAYSPGTHVELSDIIPGDEVNPSDGTSKNFSNKNVGIDKTVTAIGIVLSGADAENYDFDGTGTGTATINARPITVTAATDSKVYDGTTSSDATLTITVGTLQAGDVLNFSQTYDNKNVGGGKTLTPSGTVTDGNDGANYTITLANNTTGEITQAPLTATVTVSNKVVDGNNSATITSVTLNGILLSDVVTVNSQGTATFADAAVGNGKVVTATDVTITGGDAGNYSFSGTATGTGDILQIPAVVYVDDNWAETDMWEDPDGIGPAIYFGYDAFATIQEAVDAVATNGTVNVAAGTYDERLVINKKITLTGAGIGQTIVQPTFTPSGDTHADKADVWLSDSAASWTTIQDFSFDFNGTDGTRAGWGILIGENIATYPGLDVTDVTIQNNDIQMGLGAGGNGAGAGLGITTGLGGDSGGLVITGNAFHGDPTYMGNGSDHGSEAIYINPNGGTDLITVSDNTFDGNLFVGVSVESGKVTVSDNTIERAAGADVSSTHGIRVNDFIGGRTYSDITIQNNTISGFDNGLRLGSGSSGGSTLTVSVSNNTITDNARGIWVRNDADVTAHENAITGNTTGAELLAGSNGSLDATENYWGTAVAATVAGKISGSVEYDPYYVDAGKTILSSTVPSAVYVDDNYSDGSSGSYYFGYNAFNTVQDGVDAVTTNGTVNVAAGTYAENVMISDKSDITIQGVGETTIVEPISGIGFAITDSDDVTIKSLKIHTTGTNAHGVWVAGTPSGGSTVAGLTVQGTTIVVDGYSAGIYAEQVNPAHTGWLIGGSGNGNTITVNAGTGVTGDGLDLHDVTNSTVSDNTITLNIPTDSTNVLWTSELSNLSNLVFSNNIVSGSSGSEVAFVPNFILTGNSSTITTVTVSGNTFSNWGSRALRIGTGASSVTVSGNKFLVASVAEILKNEDDVASVNAEGNWWGQATGPATGAVVENTGIVDYRPWCTNESCSPIDTTSPTVTVDTLLTNDATPVITGTVVESNAVTVTITVNSQNYVAVVTSGTWSADVTNALTAGTYSVTATAEDSAGNIGTDATNNELTVDTTGPVTSVTAPAGGGSYNGNISITADATDASGIEKVEFWHSTTDTLISTDTVAPFAATWDSTTTAEGSHSIYVKAYDNAGNTSTSASVSVTLDRTAPAVSITSIAGDNYINNAEKAAIHVVGTAEAGSTVDVSLTGGATVTGSGTATDGNFDITISGTTLTDGTVTPSVTATDATGNVSSAVTTPTATKDIVAPMVDSHTPSINAVNVETDTITIVFNEAVNVSGVQITISPEVAFTIDDSGTDTITLSALTLESNTVYTVTVTTDVKDLAGNAIAGEYDWSFTTATLYNVALNADNGGWNLISLPIVPIDTNISAVLGDAEDSIEAVWAYDPTNVNANTENDGWFVYHPDGSDTSSLLTMTAGYGYWISVTANTAISGSGSLLTAGPTTPPSVSLDDGWNLIGYYQIPGEVSSNMDDAFSSIGLAGTDYTALFGFNNASGASTNNVDTINPGDAFWISVSPNGGKNYTPSNL